MDDPHLVCLFSMLLLSLALESISTVHLLCFMVSAVDEHSFGV